MVAKKLSSLLVLMVLGTGFLEAVENSVIPLIEQLEQINNLPAHKYSTNQSLEINAALSRKEEKIRIVSYNVLFNLHEEELDPINRWPERLPRIVELVGEMDPDLLCVQELYPDQKSDLMPHLEEKYGFYCEERTNGELNGIFYRKERFQLIASRVWSTNPNPKSYICDRVAMLKLKDLKTKRLFTVFNTHLAFSNIDRRDAQTRFLTQLIDSHAQGMAVILAGDLNTFQNRPDLTGLPFYDGDYIHRLLTQAQLTDAKELSLLGHVGPLSTYSNLPENPIPFKGTGTPGIFLDHLYVSKGITVLIHAVEPGTVGSNFPSDHLPVVADMIID
jgi:endonuclease/exonuclease/phosphatase family metal-dependent hydrolase